MSEPVKLTLAAAVSLYNLLEKLLFNSTDNEVVERDLPFNIKYKIQRVINQLAKDYEYTSTKRVELIKQFGTENEETKTIKVPSEKLDEFREEMNKIYSITVEHTFKKFTPDEVELLAIDGFSIQEIYLFTSALVDDPELAAELNRPREEKEAVEKSNIEEN